jgi:drug/metabolite transporter (DMT)-like permease
MRAPVVHAVLILVQVNFATLAGERLGSEAVLGGTLIFAGIALVVWSRRSRTVREIVRRREHSRT